MIRIIQYRDKCIGCCACVEADKNRWRMSRRDGKCTLIDGIDKKGIFNTMVVDDEWHNVMTAVKICPVNIIKAERINPYQ